MASAAIALALAAGNALAENESKESNEKKNMNRVGHTDLQGRPTYQPNVIQYPDGRYIAFVGQHSGNPVPVAGFQFLPNPLKNNADENNGSMIIDVTDPKHPVEKALIPAPFAGTSVGQSQMVRMCLGSTLPNGVSGKVYLMRNVQGGPAATQGYEVWDVTDVSSPVKVSAYYGIRSTHKLWWECNTGVAYLVGSKNPAIFAGTPNWRQTQSMVIVDWANPEAPPIHLRTFGLPGGQPGSTGATVPSLHGPISAHEHPNAAGFVARPRLLSPGGAPNPDDIIGNRIYVAWGVGDDGVMQILDRKKLLPALSNGRGGTWIPEVPVTSVDNPTVTELLDPQVGILYMSPDQGGHTAFPVFGLKPPSIQKFNEFATRDIVLLASEATADGQLDANGVRRCNEAPHWSFIVDVTVENSKTAPPGTKTQQNVWQGPMVLSTMSVDERAGEKFKRGNYCGRGARFGVHSSEENFNNPYYGKLTAIAYFNGGVRIWDIREPQAPFEVAFYVPFANDNTDPDGYMTNNVEIDDRGYIYIVDRNGAGFDILELTGCAKDVDGGKSCKDLDNDNAPPK
ncbi:MAG TPA: hypothetical protein VFJ68_04160 [Casimicrobiaceae bacterium]|nr:hypothetical protein [Casimicrobiaceae bacterium]